MAPGAGLVMFAGAGAATVSSAAVVRLSEPLDPVIRMVKLLTEVPGAVFTVMVVDPLPVTVAGLKFTDPPAGNPVTVKFTDPLNPVPGYTVTVYVALAPGTMGWGDRLAAAIMKVDALITVTPQLAVADPLALSLTVTFAE